MKSYAFDHYYTYSQLTDTLTQLAQDHPTIISLQSLCTTPKGRNVWAVTITNTATGDHQSKPGYYVDGNHHAGEATGSMAALHLIVTLVQGYGVRQDITALLDTTTIYVLPRISPDGAEAFLTTDQRLRSVDRPYPFEKPADGLHPKDMDGDGVIRLMRIKSDCGAWKPMDKDPRVMVKRSPADFGGTYYNVYPEGEIVGYDGVHIQPAEGKWNLDFNRNYPLGWFPEARQPGAGDYPLCNPENKAVADFVLAHKNICSGVTYHTSGGCYIYPPGTTSEKNAIARDMKLFREIGAMATAETGYGCFNVFDCFLTDTVNYSSGAFDDWMYQCQGIPTYTAELWDLCIRAGVPNVYPRSCPMSDEESANQMYLCYQWLDTHVSATDTWIPNKDWTPFEHPQLGWVEIGSIDFKYTWQNCPPGYLQPEVEKNTAFCLRMAAAVPRLNITHMSATQLADELYQVQATVSNLGYMATFVCGEAQKLGVDTPLVATLTGAQGFVSGAPTAQIGHLEGFGGINTYYNYDNIVTDKHDPTTKVVTYIIKAKPNQEITLTVQNPKSGQAKAQITLK